MLERITEIRDTLLAYVEARVEMLRTDFQARFEDTVVLIVYFVLLVAAATAGLIFLFALLAAALNIWLQSQYVGWLLVFLLFALPFVCLVVFKRFFLRLIRQLLNQILKIRPD